MIIRIVRMTFREDKISEFLAIFDQYKEAIRKQPGCTHLELLQDYNHTNVYSTYSYFGKVWPATKKLFSAKPEAHSYLVRAKID
jgi:quinol monooxygenase YgiN